MLPEGSKHRILAVVDEMLTQLFSHTKTGSHSGLFTIGTRRDTKRQKKCNPNCNQIGRFSP